MNSSSTLAAISKLKNGSGDYLLVPGLQAGQSSRLLGLPIIECPDLPDLAASSKSIVLGDWSRYRIFDKSEGTTVLRDPYSQATTGIVRFHGRRRVGATLTMPEAFRIMVTGT
jgi:HK97 family phage major capsid protein